MKITHSRNIEGRFVVKLPKKKDCNVLGDSREAAQRRLFYEEKNEKIQNLEDYIVNFWKNMKNLDTRVS